LVVSSIERLRTTDEPIAANIESQQALGCACNADPFALPDFAGRSTVRSEPQRTGLTKVDPVQSAVNFQGYTQPSRAACQVSHVLGAAILLHDRDACVGSIALIKTPAPTPGASLETLSMNEMP
jgi:hypothetical protein